jgi:hypothetical protein
MFYSIFLPSVFLLGIVFCQTFKPAPGSFPAKGDGDFAGGIFSVSLSDLPKYFGARGTGSEAPKTPRARTAGTGPYPAVMTTDSTLPGHIIFAPKTPPSSNLSLPFIAWGNGACVLSAGEYEHLLVEIASCGYIIAANGSPTAGGSAAQQSKVQDMRDSLSWAFAGKAAKYGTIDLTNVTTVGHSCGGLEVMSTAYHDECVKRIVMFNIAIFQDDRRYLLKEIKVPVAYFIGGSKDMGYTTVSTRNCQGLYGEKLMRHSRRRTMRCLMLGCQSSGQISILAMEVCFPRLMVGKRVGRLLHTWSGSEEGTRLRRRTS